MTTILRPDGTATGSLILRTNLETLSLQGTIPIGTVYLRTVWNSTTSTALASVVGDGTFIFPDPSIYPDGYPLEMGENTLTVTPYGAGDAPLDGDASAMVERVSPSTPYLSPTAVVLERMDGYVRVRARAPSEGSPSGFNVYASTRPGGTGVGYFKVNAQPVTALETETVQTPLVRTFATSVVPEGAVTIRTVVTLLNEAGETVGTVMEGDTEVGTGVTEVGFDATLSSVETVRYFQFSHDRNASRGPDVANTVYFAALGIAADEPLYYVVTATYYNTATGELYESPYSVEVVGYPTNIRGGSATLPSVSRSLILESMILDIYSADPSLALTPGSTIRDTFLDPMAAEVERCRFLLDFIYRSTDLDSLVAIDDPQGLGVSSNPETSSYKTALARALYLTNVTDVQAVIDGAFDRLGRRFGIPREPAKRAIGEVVWLTTEAPISTIVVPFGSRATGAGQEFRTTREVSLGSGQVAGSFDPSVNAYVIRAPIEATTPGAAGNLERGAVRGSGVYGLAVSNPASTYGGLDTQTNTQYAAAIRRAAAGVDTNTEAGYLRVAASVPGVYSSWVADSGSEMMFRNDTAPVDAWIRGTLPSEVTESFAFQYVEKRGVIFEVVGDPADGRFQSADPGLSVSNPIAEMLDYESMGLGLRNVNTGLYYNLTGVTFVRYDTIQLDMSLAQPPTTLTSLLVGDYRYAAAEDYQLQSQPVVDVYQVEGQVSGALDPSIFDLRRTRPGLTYGNSVDAEDALAFLETTDPEVVVPSGDLIAVTDELAVMRGTSLTFLVYLGADPYSLVVENFTSTVTYAGPGSAAPDYEIVYGDVRTPLAIRRTAASTILAGDTVRMAYLHRENFFVRYATDLAVQKAQELLAGEGGQSTSVLARGTYAVPVDIEMVVEFELGADRAAIGKAVQDQLAYLFQGTGLGGAIVESEVVRRAGDVPRVSAVPLPLTFFGRAERAPVMPSLG